MLVRTLRKTLDEGEAEAIAFACEIGVDVVLLDERDARREAERLGLAVLGTVGILLWAKRSGCLASLREALDALRTQAKFRIGPSLYDRVLQEAGKVNPGAKFNAFLGRGAFLRMSRSKRAASLIRAIRVLRG